MMRLSLLLLTTILLPCIARADILVLATEPYPPFVMVEGDNVSGRGIRMVDLVMKETGQDYRIEVMPWARAIALARNDSAYCAFAAARTPDRERLFKWVEPLLITRNYLVAASETGVRPKTLEEAKRYVVGTHRHDFTEALLKRLEFPRIDVAVDFNLSFRKLLNRRIDLMPMSERTFRSLTQAGEKLEKTVLLAEQPLGIACNPSVPDDLIDRMNANLRRATESGELERILSDVR
ncbi:transporter substrate-binding domain-containing protein [Rhizobiaceae bacterium BDR2-2]|uniref:Transporter substrate-binding domain-containing protein n=1 Tax=Ectorhizobium quercum TaxID=2965071 RepID=A0AAE3SV45_9HYPH|nr:transporter substrate-binding domain-containing protein [Ectorhizobium quercum]MCX8996579.1 transporter substrate-binding domain-containing protein [Ectorhizobium quercum]